MFKKSITLILIAALLLPLLGQVRAVNSIPTAHGIDVSHHQGVIDWDTVAKHIDFAIIRCGYGSDLTSQDDRQWKANVEACTRLKIPFGVYIYSHATTEEEARSEARHVLRLLKGYKPSMPVYLDLEDEDISENCTPAQILANATVFCDMIRDAGYTPGIYANTNWWSTYLSSSQYDKWDRWVARYNSTLNFNRPYSMWQYTSQGSVPGIQGDVDMNRWYGDKPTVGCSHSYTFRVKQEPTCTAQGIRLYTCSLCGDTYEEKISPKGHSYSKEVVAPTCTVGGYTLSTCSACGHSYRGEETAPTGHSWDGGRITVEPTETEAGEKVYSCNGCGLTMTVTVPALGGHENRCPSVAFTDVPPYGNWAHEGIDFVLEQGLFQGVSDTLFAPDRTMTRAMVVTVLWRNAGSPQGGKAEFVDVEPGQWYTEAVAWAAENNIVNGVGEGRFAPMSQITREQLATILYRYGGGEEGNSNDHTGDHLKQFPDEAAVSSYARQALTWAIEQGLINGVHTDGISYLKPQGSATRAQTAAILYRWLKQS